MAPSHTLPSSCTKRDHRDEKYYRRLPWTSHDLEPDSFSVSDRQTLQKGEHSHNSSFTSDVTADTALAGATTVYRTTPTLCAMSLARARLLAGEVSFRQTEVPSLRGGKAA